MDTYCIQEIVHHSNPGLLNPIISYDECLIQGIDDFIQCQPCNVQGFYIQKITEEDSEDIDDSENSSLEVHDSEDERAWSTNSNSGRQNRESDGNSDDIHSSNEIIEVHASSSPLTTDNLHHD